MIDASVPGNQTGVANETDGLRPIGSIGKSQTVLKDGEEAVLFEHQGKGCLSHFWFGGNFKGVEDTRIRYYVDGEETASIDMDLNLGHGIGFHDNQAPWATKFVGKIGKRNGLFNNYRIPFGTSIRVTAQRSGEAAADGHIWWIIRGVENGRVTLGGVQLPAAARLKLHRLEEQEVDPLAEFTLADISGKGAIYQVTMTAEGLDDTPDRINYLEACMRAYLDGSKKPLMLSSGLEDYFLGTYYFLAFRRFYVARVAVEKSAAIFPAIRRDPLRRGPDAKIVSRTVSSRRAASRPRHEPYPCQGATQTRSFC
jgi:hypothetical protein